MFETVKKILIEQLNIKNKEITPQSKIKEDLGADSHDVLQMLMTIEQEHGIVIPDDKLASFETVQDIVDYMESAGK